MENYKVVEKKNKNAVHCIAWSRDRADSWIDKYGDSKMFADKSLTKSSFTVIKITK